jgi:hypothetical protein
VESHSQHPTWGLSQSSQSPPPQRLLCVPNPRVCLEVSEAHLSRRGPPYHGCHPSSTPPLRLLYPGYVFMHV